MILEVWVPRGRSGSRSLIEVYLLETCQFDLKHHSPIIRYLHLINLTQTGLNATAVASFVAGFDLGDLGDLDLGDLDLGDLDLHDLIANSSGEIDPTTTLPGQYQDIVVGSALGAVFQVILGVVRAIHDTLEAVRDKIAIVYTFLGLDRDVHPGRATGEDEEEGALQSTNELQDHVHT